MGQVGAVLRKTTTGYAHYCPACDGIHQIFVGGPTPPNWTFDGNIDQPTFSPSIRVFHPKHKDLEGVEHAEKTVCHYFLKAGVIEYCTDNPHKFNGKKVPLPELGERYSDKNYGW